ncbi:MAG: glycosyltransferase family 4 protein [Flavobacteriales bacterium]|nr:glycosyltransferase family 4 protein [Flavobacteriales bacterium]
MAVVAINTRLVVPGKLDGIGWFTLETVQRMTAAHPEHQFHLLFDREPPEDLFPGANVECHWVWPPARRPFLLDIWFDWAVPRILKRVKADIFVSPDGFLSSKTNVAQVAVQHDLNFEHHPEWLPEGVAKHYKRRFPSAAKRATRIATVSQFSADDIHNRYGVARDHIDVVYNGAGSVYHSAPLGANAQQQARLVRQKYTNGQPFFVFVGTQHPRKNLQGLMQAFSAYRAQGGKWDLMLVGTALWRRRRFDARRSMDELPGHVRDHVHTSGWLAQDELAQVLSSAGALVFIPWFEGFGIPMVEAFAAGTPVIHGNRTSLPEVANGAGIEVDPGDAEQVARAMRQIEEGPALRADLIEKGRDRADDFSWERTSSLLWSCIAKAGSEAGIDIVDEQAAQVSF